VYRGHHGAIAVAKQDRQAVGHHNGARQVGFTGKDSIGRHVICRTSRQFQHLRAMDLIQEYRSNTGGSVKHRTVASDIASIIPYV
jgi:hypothetical protein